VSIFVLSSSSSGFFANEDVFTVTKNSQSNSLAVLLNDAILPNTAKHYSSAMSAWARTRPTTVVPSPSILQTKLLVYTAANNFVGEESFTYETRLRDARPRTGPCPGCG